MTAIEGGNRILKFVLKELEHKWKILRRKYSNVKGKILYALLFILNHKYKPRVSSERYGEDLNWFRSMLRTLDVLLSREWNSIDLRMTQEEIDKYGTIVLSEFSNLGKLWDLYLECTAFKVERLVLEEGQSVFDAKMKIDSAFEDWLRTSLLDAEWFDYHDATSNRAKQLLKAINQELKKKHGVTLEFLNEFGKDIEKEIRIRLEPEETRMVSLIGFREEHLLARLRSSDKNVDVNALIDELEYKPDGSWIRTPFVRLKENSTQEIVYFPINSTFYPCNIFAGSWVYHIPKVVRKSSALGIMGDVWGVGFENYVRDKLHKCHPHLEIESGTTIITRSDFPDISDCVGKPKIEIDVIAHSEENVYLISCKALDQFYGPKMVRTLLSATFEEFEKNLREDIRMAGEIEGYAHCVRQSNKYLESMGYEGKEIVPILMTSDVRPLSLESVREWSVDVKIVNTLPDVQIIQAKKMDVFPFD